MDTGAPRTVVIGRNSTVWARLRERLPDQTAGAMALSHGEIAGAAIGAQDRVWVFSYSREAAENRALLAALQTKGAGSYHYLSTATANVAEVTRCYSYPRAKAEAEGDALALLNAEIVRVGVVYGEATELPGGTTAATSLDEIAAAMFAMPAGAPRSRRNLFTMIERPFRSAGEAALYRIYGGLLSAAGGLPCLLRPLDLLLRGAGMRWYGYLYLSNRLWLRGRGERRDE